MLNTISTNTIEAIISRTEFLEHYKTFDKDLAVISISEPSQEGYNDEQIPDDIINYFDANIKVKFWDIEEDFGNYKIIPDDVAKQVQHFIINNVDKTFLIHCRAGQSRSAGVGKAVECIKFFGIGDEAKYNYQTGFNSEIDKHARYSPNLTVFDKVIKEY